MLQFDDSCYVDAKQYHLALFSTRHAKYLTSLTNQNARFYSMMRFYKIRYEHLLTLRCIEIYSCEHLQIENNLTQEEQNIEDCCSFCCLF